MVLLFMVIGKANPSLSVRSSWTVYGTFVDAGILLFLIHLLSKEGMRVKDLISMYKSKLKIDLLTDLGILLIIFPCQKL
jgi:hypothetical protein